MIGVCKLQNRTENENKNIDVSFDNRKMQLLQNCTKKGILGEKMKRCDDQSSVRKKQMFCQGEE